MFDKLREHSRYAEKTIQKTDAHLSNINLDGVEEKNIDCVINLDFSFENDIDDLLRQTRATHIEVEDLKQEADESISVLTKQLEYLEEYFNLKPIEIVDDSNNDREKLKNSEQIIIHEPEEEVSDVEDEHSVTNVKENIAPPVNEATSLLAQLEMKERARLITPPKHICSKIVERELAKRRAAANVTIMSDE